jgi:hypothetical protein
VAAVVVQGREHLLLLVRHLLLLERISVVVEKDVAERAKRPSIREKLQRAYVEQWRR